MRKFWATIAIVLGAVAFAGCAQTDPAPIDENTLSSVVFSQNKAVPDYDSAEYTKTDEASLSELQAILDKYDWDPAASTGNDDCDGGTSTDATLTWNDGTSNELSMYRCGNSSSEFVVEATELFSSWH